MRTGTISLFFLSLSVFAAPTPEPATASSNPDIAITWENAQSDPSGVALAIYNAAMAEVEANGTDADAVHARAANGGGPPNSALNTLLAAADKLPFIGQSLDAVGSVITDVETPLAALLGVQTTQNGGSACTAMTVIFARGTTEPGNVGLVTGPPFFDALTSIMGAQALNIQGVDYGATITEFIEGGDPAGGKTMAQLVETSLQKCPNSKVVMAGYSQGGQLVHNAAKLLSNDTVAKVNSAVIFGDPDFGTPIAGVANQKIICHADDNICQHGDLILASHLDYALNAQEAAQFVATTAGLEKRGIMI